METTQIKIGGMSCQGCVKNIQGVLMALPGVQSAVVSLEAEMADVAFDAAQLDRAALVGAIEDAGFDAS
ncbi:MAG: heavy-metal-associated domain-containing protein [Azonexus sp.]|nr:heavy-metal-associated domain-containing protein [Azonexus sp.]